MDLELVQTEELVEELLKRFDAGVVACWTPLDEQRASVMMKTKGDMIPLLGIMSYLNDGFETALDRTIRNNGDDEIQS